MKEFILPEINSERWKSLENLRGEVWKDIEEFEYYQVSNYGRVKVLEHPINVHGKIHGNYTRIQRESIKLSADNGNGYRIVSIMGKMRYVHRLVAKAFVPNPKNYPHIDHINTDKSDNRAENLRWTDAAGNAHNPLTQITRNENDKNNMKPIVQLDLDGNFVRVWESATTAAKSLGVLRSHIVAILSDKMQTKTCKGFQFVKLEDYDEHKDYKVRISYNHATKNKSLHDRIIVEIVNNDITNIFINSREAGEHYNVCHSLIRRCCKYNAEGIRKNPKTFTNVFWITDIPEKLRPIAEAKFREKYPL